MRKAFTLVELLVAISITMLMFILISQLFNRTSQAVSTGIAVAENVSSSRVVSEQIERDFKDLVGPDHTTASNATGGVLVIANRAIHFNQGTFQVRDENGSPTNVVAHGVELAKPHGPDDFKLFANGTTLGSEIRSGNVVYRPVRSDHIMFIREVQPGEIPITPGSDLTFTSFDDGGLSKYQVVRYQHGKRIDSDNPTDYSQVLGATGTDQRATDWILTRQALFLGEQDTDASTDTNTPTYYAASAACSDLYAGMTDYAYFSLTDVSHPNGCLIGEVPAVSNPSLQLLSTLSAADYHTRAVDLYTYTNTRLHVNVAPQSFESRVIAQQHPYLVEHVSDFIVEFAADIHTLDTIDGVPDGAVDFDASASGADYEYIGGNVRWYGFWYNDPVRNERRTVNGTDIFDPNMPVVYEPPAGWEPYQTHDRNGDSNPDDGTFVFRHDDKLGQRIPGYDPATHKHTSHWPYLLRIRHRVHDKRGILKQGNNQHGMWFEQIVKVER